jgi:tetratricopeptide (TPR) repeat protein
MDHYYNFYLGLCYLQLCQLDSAESLFRSCIQRDQASGSNWVHYLHVFYLGVTLYEESKYAAAISVFDSALERYPRFSDAKFYKAVCFDKLKQQESVLPLLLDAQKDLRDGYTINEDNVIYEQYPYQLRPSRLETWIASLQEEQSKKH